jgi:hypothetical protein
MVRYWRPPGLDRHTVQSAIPEPQWILAEQHGLDHCQTQSVWRPVTDFSGNRKSCDICLGVSTHHLDGREYILTSNRTSRMNHASIIVTNGIHRQDHRTLLLLRLSLLLLLPPRTLPRVVQVRILQRLLLLLLARLNILVLVGLLAGLQLSWAMLRLRRPLPWLLGTKLNPEAQLSLLQRFRHTTKIPLSELVVPLPR